MWLLLLFIHVIGLTGFNLTLRKSLLEKADRLTMAAIMQTGLAIPAVPILLFNPVEFSAYRPRDYLILIIIIIFTIGLQVSNVKALQYLEAGVYPVIYNLRILITTILGILLVNEDAEWTRIFGGLLILLAIFIVRQKGSRKVRLKGLQWGLTAAFIVSFLNANEKIMINHVGLWNYFPLAMIISALIMWFGLFARKTKPEIKVFMKPATTKLMAYRAISGYGFTGALSAGALVSVANYVSSMSVILMVIAGVILLDERDYLWRKIAATTVAVAGLTIVLCSHLP